MSYLSDLLGTSYKEGMTEDEISTVLEGIGEGNTTEITKLKAALSKANSEAADYKKQLKSKLTEEEAQQATQKEEWDKMMQENAELKRSMLVNDNKTKLIAQGYDEKLADATAIAMIDGDFDTVMANQKIFNEVQKKAISAELMKKTPRPTAGSENAGKMDYPKKIAEAQANGDYSTAAYYTRLMAQESATEQTEE